jgi:hypothetical protein
VEEWLLTIVLVHIVECRGQNIILPMHKIWDHAMIKKIRRCSNCSAIEEEFEE